MRSKDELQRYREQLFDRLLAGEDISQITKGMTAADQRELKRHIATVRNSYEQSSTNQSNKQ